MLFCTRVDGQAVLAGLKVVEQVGAVLVGKRLAVDTRIDVERFDPRGRDGGAGLVGDVPREGTIEDLGLNGKRQQEKGANKAHEHPSDAGQYIMRKRRCKAAAINCESDDSEP
jgi:hypothetical protein